MKSPKETSTPVEEINESNRPLSSADVCIDIPCSHLYQTSADLIRVYVHNIKNN